MIPATCPHCGHGHGKVLETRTSANGKRQRVRCAKCAATFALYANGAVLKSALSSTHRALAGLPK